MPTILDRLPISTRDDFLFVGQERVAIKAFEIATWVSLGIRRGGPFSPAAPRFPALIDTAHTHFFAIQEKHLRRWAQLRPEELRIQGQVRQGGRTLQLHAAVLWVFPNVPGQRDDLQDRPPFRLELARGIAVYPDEFRFPRLPLIGLRTLLENRLVTTIDGTRRQMTVRTPPRWWWS
jgi:hypothetical protein